MYEITKEIARSEITLCCLQEVRYLNYGSKLIRLNNGENFKFIWCGKKKRRELGVGFLIKDDPRIIVDEPDVKDPRMLAVNITVYGFKIRLVNAYSPTENGNDTQKDAFYRLLEKACKTEDKHRKLIIAGDFNATTSISLKKCSYDWSKIVEDELCNENGSRIKSFCRKLRLCMPQTYFDQPLPERYTWLSNDGRTKKVLDYVLTESYVQQFIKDCRVNNDLDIESDHRLLLANLVTPETKKARKKPKQSAKIRKYDLKALKNEEIKTKFKQAVQAVLQTGETESANAKSIKLVNCLSAAAESTIPVKKVTRNVKELWRDDVLLNSLLDRRKTVVKTSSEHKLITKQIKARVNRLRNEKLEQEAREINSFATKKEVENLYRSFKSDNSTFVNTKRSKSCDPASLKQHFQKHFDDDRDEADPISFTVLPDYIEKLQKIKCEKIKTSSPSSDEILQVVKKLKDGKAANDIPSAFIKHAIECEEFLKELTSLYETVWKYHILPVNWGHSRLIAIWKGPTKGKIEDPEAYRGLQVGASLCKIMVVIIINRLRDWYESQLSDNQQGFRSGRGTTDGIYMAKKVQQITHSMKKKAYLLFVDLSAAFDRVRRSWLFKTLMSRFSSNADRSLIQLLKSLYDHTTTSLGDSPDDTFETKSGVRQGGPESPLLFNLFIDFVMRIYINECRNNGIKFLSLKYFIPSQASQNNKAAAGNFEVDWIGYADDLLLIFDDKDSLRRGLALLDSIFQQFNLKINASKTKTMILNDENDYPKTIASLQGKAIDNVESFVYLGCILNYNEPSTGETEINLRIDAAENAFYSHGKNLMNQKIALKTRVQILDSLVRSRLIYSCPIWTLTASQRSKISSAYTSTLRKMVKNGFKRKENQWSFVYTNEDIKRICHASDVLKFVMSQQRNYAAHIIRMDNSSIAKRLFFNNDRSRRQGRQLTLKTIVLKNEECNEIEFFERAMRRNF